MIDININILKVINKMIPRDFCHPHLDSKKKIDRINPHCFLNYSCKRASIMLIREKLRFKEILLKSIIENKVIMFINQ